MLEDLLSIMIFMHVCNTVWKAKGGGEGEENDEGGKSDKMIAKFSQNQAMLEVDAKQIRFLKIKTLRT